MKPSLPVGWFDFAIIPNHDLPQKNEHVLATQGVLNPIVNEQRHQAGRCLILIGGPSKRHGWDQTQLIQHIQAITEIGYQQFILTTSRRTPTDFLQALAMQNLAEQIKIFPVEQTPQGWLFEQLHQAETVWVTEDSVSMLFEALTAGCKVGILSMPRLKQDRITSAIDQLLSQHQVGTINRLPDLVQPLTEADRAAKWIMSQYL
jgi:mitochondrial fission protein ELM1